MHVSLGSKEHIASLAQKLREVEAEGPFLVSMDHSPSEQLGSGIRHTTVLILSSRVAHHDLANRVALKLRPTLGTLKKWSQANRRYRRDFLSTLFAELQYVSDIQVFAQSATEAAIRESIPHCIDQLGLGAIYAPYRSDYDSVRVQIGPVYRASDPASPIIFSLSQNRADMCIFIAHFVRRVQQTMFEALNIDGRQLPAGFNWNFLADKFPGVPDADMDLLFQVLLLSPPRLGRTVWGYFNEGDVQATDLLADNLAGALNGISLKPERLGDAPQFTSAGCAFSWELLDV